MSRPQQRHARTINPELLLDEALFQAERSSGSPVRIIYLGLHTIADREGRFTWDYSLKRFLMLDEPDVIEHAMDALHDAGKLVRYRLDGVEYGQLADFAETQHVNPRERRSQLPDPNTKGVEILGLEGEVIMVSDGRGSKKPAKINIKKKSGDDNPKPESTEGLPAGQINGTPLLSGGLIFKKTKMGNSTGLVRLDPDEQYPVLPLDKDDMSPVLYEAGVFPIIGGEGIWITEARLEYFEQLYPHADNLQRLKVAADWLRSNPEKKKTLGGISKYISGFLLRSQNSNQFSYKPGAVGSNIATLTAPTRADGRVQQTSGAVGSVFKRLQDRRDGVVHAAN